ncbi:MAG: hypothetical protein GKR88_16540 [Flavobacteriaceae bacterium]|nr:MAG: hypothetical protein GKR88_16540 [Flavobacteriaceae bacterium]
MERMNLNLRTHIKRLIDYPLLY